MSNAPVIFMRGASRGIKLEVSRWLAIAGARICTLARSFRATTKAAELFLETALNSIPDAVASL
jgi:NAD(P)-dependent dehydrogenase (short-subunit alcohol dehydrogenase family)